ncbi:MAG: radical SAM protein [Deltaproteobacteria bacterium]|nr:radical SAM protein [Deltaproteobacteria bacterium]
MTEERYDPVERAKEVAEIVCRGDLRKYYRFRPARFYGGIVTSDCVGCCLGCLFCWSWHQVVAPEQYGRFYSPREVAGSLTGIARRKRFRQVRISGNEPTLSREHLIKVLDLIPENVLFILETNGILIGHDRTYAEDLARYENIYVRVSFKGCSGEEFSLLTGATSQGFDLQMSALENLYRAGVRVHPAVMVSFSSQDNIRSLRSRLGSINRTFADIEVEELVLYGDVEDQLKKAKLTYGAAYTPSCIPPEQI